MIFEENKLQCYMRNHSRVIAIFVARGRQSPLIKLVKVGGQTAFK